MLQSTSNHRGQENLSAFIHARPWFKLVSGFFKVALDVNAAVNPRDVDLARFRLDPALQYPALPFFGLLGFPLLASDCSRLADLNPTSHPTLASNPRVHLSTLHNSRPKITAQNSSDFRLS